MKKYISFFALCVVFLPSCHMMPGYTLTMAPWIVDSNASELQKAAMWDGCAIANTREILSTNVRHAGRVEVDSEYAGDNAYTTAWRYGFFYCAMYGGAQILGGSYTRPWNAVGFKGGGVSYKSQ